MCSLGYGPPPAFAFRSIRRTVRELRAQTCRPAVVADLAAVISCPANVSHAKLCGQGPRAGAEAARRLPRMTFEEPSRDLQAP